MTVTQFAAVGAVYLIVGLFLSRWWWRRDVTPDAATSQIMAFWIVVLWPIWLIGIPVFAFVTWFYGTPLRRNDEE